MSEAAEQATDGQTIAGALPAAVDANTQQESAPAEKSESARESNGNGYQGPVDLSGLPDDIRVPVEARIGHLTKLMGKQDRKYSSQLKEWREVAEQQSRIIEELQNGVGAVVDHLSDKSLNDAEAQAKRDLRAAHESGDTDLFVTANDKLAEIKARKIALAQQKKTSKPKEQQPQQRQYASASSLAEDGVADGDLTSDDARAIGAWQSETDQNGNALRPWATSKNPANPTADPLYRRAIIESAAVFDEASPWADKTTAEKLAEVDRRMGLVKPASSQSVMGGKLTLPAKNQKIGLTAYQEQLAVKTKFGGPKAKSDSDHIEAYRKQVQSYNAKKGQR